MHRSLLIYLWPEIRETLLIKIYLLTFKGIGGIAKFLRCDFLACSINLWLFHVIFDKA